MSFFFIYVIYITYKTYILKSGREKLCLIFFFFLQTLQDFFLLDMRNLFRLLIHHRSKLSKRKKVYRVLFHVYRALNRRLSLDIFRIISAKSVLGWSRGLKSVAFGAAERSKRLDHRVNQKHLILIHSHSRLVSNTTNTRLRVVLYIGHACG